MCVADSPKLKKHNVEKILVNLLSAAADNNVKTAICEAVKVMSSNQASKDCFRDRGIHRTFMLKHCNTDTQTQ